MSVFVSNIFQIS